MAVPAIRSGFVRFTTTKAPAALDTPFRGVSMSAVRKNGGAPVSVWLTPEERAKLTSRAERAGVSLGAYVRSSCLDTPPPRTARRPHPDKAELARLLGAVGKIGGNINQLAKLANAGAWPEAAAIYEARADILWMRRALMAALGRPDPESDEPLNTEPDP
jgi:hypothetical protein